MTSKLKINQIKQVVNTHQVGKLDEVWTSVFSLTSTALQSYSSAL
jgi:hypothetical protein